ncbi:TPA: hypothetical protein ACPJ21_004782, partial [Vibrio alginolyticus]|nr:hypothetical protein [Vibrio parahaemolyticus]EIB6499078.1 hypothetical protein [Vibrio parahaemolyticus]EII3017733.1 hypothetical protein [Vibrio parahaemolyticus]EII5694504.1 hypothetical protein [Vibrio parahaemolyticus]HCH5895131.1 hypothetical protein [Vibrio parahaemolyticus]
KHVEIKGVGALIKREGYWEIEPINLNGATIYIEKEHVTDEDVEAIERISASWLETIKECYSYIEQNRESYGMEAKKFSNPNVFLNSTLEWTVYFDTESELEAVVGVEFLGNKPNQLVIGD